jgi:hypothetical protein
MPPNTGGMRNEPQPKLLPLFSMAHRLGVPSTWLKAEAECGRVPALKAGKRFLFIPEVVEAVLAERAAALPEGTAKHAE